MFQARLVTLGRSVPGMVQVAARFAVPAPRRSFAHLTTSKPRTVLSGIQPTGVPHLGNYLGALSNWVDMQRDAAPDDVILYCSAGYHALTLPQDPMTLRDDRSNLLASLLAIGIDPQRSIVFHQDQIPEHTELAWILNCITPMGKLQRMTTWKSKLAVSRNANSESEVDESHLNLGLFAYPVLQAADVLLYKTTHVPVGEDQQQHLELSRDLAELFNRTYSSKVFPHPRHIIAPTKRVLSLRDPSQKMSKSAPNVKSRILITDTFAEISAKLRSATTDSMQGLTYDPVQRPGVSNLFSILAACEGNGESPAEVAQRYAGKHHSDLKHDTAGAVEARLAPIRAEYQRLKADKSWLQELSNQGAERARAIARKTMKEVKKTIGLE